MIGGGLTLSQNINGMTEEVQEGFKKCSKCGKVKTVCCFGVRKVSKDGHNPKCKICMNEYNMSYYSKNSDDILHNHKKWDSEHPARSAELRKTKFENYKNKNRVKINEWRREYNKENRDKISEYIAKRRGFGFSPINPHFEGSEFHHLHTNFEGEEDHAIGIYIPMDLHQSIYHNSFTWAGMEEMNEAALNWYFENLTGKSYIDIKKSQKSLFEF